jgi:hypothetical protein
MHNNSCASQENACKARHKQVHERARPVEECQFLSLLFKEKKAKGRACRQKTGVLHIGRQLVGSLSYYFLARTVVPKGLGTHQRALF